MKLSTVTNIYKLDHNNKPIDPKLSMKKAKALGFEVMDLSIGTCKDQPDHPMNGPQWKQWVDEIGNEAAKLGISLESAHLPFSGPGDPVYDGAEKQAHYEAVKYRCIEALGMLKIPWGTEHLLMEIEDQARPDLSKSKNLDYFKPFVEAAARFDVGIAFENMPMPQNKRFKLRYPVTHLELIDFVDSFGMPNVGITWDSGHANHVYHDQYEALIAMGKRIKVTHVQDNLGLLDDHLSPCVGTIDWERCMQGLADGGYEGNFNLETGKFAAGKPEEVQDILNEYSFKIGQYLMRRYAYYKNESSI